MSPSESQPDSEFKNQVKSEQKGYLVLKTYWFIPGLSLSEYVIVRGDPNTAKFM